MAGAEKLLADLPAKLGPGVRVVRAPCMGACDRAPVCAVGHVQVMQADEDSVTTAARKSAHAHPHQPQVDFDAYRAAAATSCSKTASSDRRTRDDMIKIGRRRRPARARRRGFPDRTQVDAGARRPAPRLMAVNGDEGEPGTFKDRHYLGLDPHRFIEGMLIAAWVVEAADIYVYLRDEYPELIADAARGIRARRGGRAGAARHASICAAAPAPTSAAKSPR